MAITQPGPKPNNLGQGKTEDEGEESDEYEVADEESGDDGEDGDSDEDTEAEDEQRRGGLTALLLGENTGDGGVGEEDEGWVPEGGKEPADYSGEEDEEEEEEDNEQQEPIGSGVIAKSPETPSNGAASSGSKKRIRENEPTEDESRDEKKAKLSTDTTAEP